MTIAVTIQTATDTRVLTGTAGEPLEAVLARAGVHVDRRCGGRGWCDGCLVQVRDGDVRVGGSSVSAGPVRSCQARLGPSPSLTCVVPRRSQVAMGTRVERDFLLDATPSGPPLADGIGVAIDLGTTTLAAVAIDATTGAVLATAGCLNEQALLADDVVSRIDHCMRDPGQLAVYARTVRAGLRSLLDHLATATPDQPSVIAIAGNATMLHLLRGQDPAPLGVAPFTPRFRDTRWTTRGELDLGEAANTPVVLLPTISAFVGADLTAGIAATNLATRPGTSLLVDLGTNGEIVLARDGALSGCATAAGPAFEGRGLSHGSRAVPGAVFRIDQTGTDLHARTIDDQPPGSICGSAFIDLLALGREHDWLLPTGRFAETPGQPLVTTDAAGDRAVIVAPGVTCSERDIAALLQAKGAIAAGIVTLLGHHGLTPGDLDRVFLAGGFGRHVDIAHCVACGLLPDIPPERVASVGNSALAGTVLALQDRSALERMQASIDAVTIVELNRDPAFEMTYIEHLALP